MPCGYPPLSFHPCAGWRLSTDPGVEFGEEHNDWMLRSDGGYEFELGHRWTLAPGVVYDDIEYGKRTYIFGLAFGRGFHVFGVRHQASYML